MKQDYLEKMRKGEPLSFSHLLTMTIQLSIPTVLAQVSFILMEYVDASMVGRLGASASAAIGLVSSTTWLFGGLISAVTVGFSVQTAHRIGAGEEEEARAAMRQGLRTALLISLVMAGVGCAIYRQLPVWLGGESDVLKDASLYFLIFALAIPFNQFNNFAAGMLQSSGNMKTPGILETLMCVINVGFNYLFIYICGLGVAGAALGTALAEAVTALPMGWFLLVKSPALHLRKGEPYRRSGITMKKAVKIAWPVALEQVIMCSAYIMSTAIVAPLGTVSVAAHSLAITAESLCYMPGYGIAAAAATMIGQSIGAGRTDLTRRLGYIVTFFGMAVMGVSGAAMFALAPLMMRLLTPVAAVCELGAAVLRIEVFAEPMYAASIVASGVFRGAGDTFVPSCMNLLSMWGIRIPLSAFLAVRMGLKGVWIAMCAELCFRDVIFLVRLAVRQRKAIPDTV